MVMRKKLLSFQLAIIMCLGMLNISAHAAPTKESVEAELNPYKVFTLDLSEYDAEDAAPIAKNGMKESDGAAGITVSGTNGKNGPELIKYYDGNTGKMIYAMQPAQDPDVTGLAGTANRNGVISISAAALTEIFGNDATSASTNGDDMTVAFWAKSYQVRASNANMFNYDGAMRLYNYYPSIVELNVTPGCKANTSVPSADKWHFYTISRKWTDKGNGKGTTTYIIKIDGSDVIYLGNGNNVTTGTSSEQNHTNMSAKTLVIGGSSATSMVDYGEIADFTIYNKALSEDEMEKLYTYVEKSRFSNIIMPEDIGDTLALKKNALAISPEEASFDIEFNNFIDDASVASGVTFTEEDGITEVPAEISASGATITVRPTGEGLLYDKTYKLTVNADLKSTVEGVTTVPGIVTISTGSGDVSLIDLKEDLKYMNEGAFTGSDYYQTTNAAHSTLTVVKPETGDTYVDIATVYPQWGVLGYNVPKEYRDAFVVETTFKFTDSAFHRGLFFADANWGGFGRNNGNPFSGYAIDAVTGFTTLRFEFNKTQSGYDVTVVGTKTGALEISRETSSFAVPNTWNGNIYLGQFNYSSGQTAHILVSDFKVKPMVYPEATGVNTDNLDMGEDEILLSFNKKMAESTMTDEAFVLTDTTEDRIVSTSFESYNAGKRKAIVKLNEYLDAGHSYKLTFNGINCDEGFSITEDKAITFTFNASIPSATVTTENDNSLKVDVEGISSDAKVRGFMMLYDEQGRAVSISSAEKTGNGSFTVSVPNGAIEGYTLKYFVWEETANGYDVICDGTFVIE